MAGLIGYKDNRLDLLAAGLAEVLAGPRSSVTAFTPDLVVVQSLPLRRWLAMRIAAANRIFANVEFPFLATLVSRVLGLPRDQQSSIELLAWKIFNALPSLCSTKHFAVVAEYLRGSDQLKRFQLSVGLAQLFDQYRVYRPEMISAWEAGKNSNRPDELWQADLWRKVADPPYSSEPLRQAVMNGFGNGDQLPLAWRLSVFAPTGIPPVYLDLLFRLAEVREVYLFQLQPSPQYRGTDLTTKQRARLKLPDAENSSTGNPLVTSSGRLDVELTNTLLEAEERHGTSIDFRKENFVAPKPVNLLTTLQADIFEGVNRGGEDARGSPRRIRPLADTEQEAGSAEPGAQSRTSNGQRSTLNAKAEKRVQAELWEQAHQRFATANPSLGGSEVGREREETAEHRAQKPEDRGRTEHREDRREDTEEHGVERMRVEANDLSIQIHSCHSAMREVEVLYDQLLALFEDLPGLEPRDILVMSPDIEAYSPLIRAVFGYPEDARMRIPFSISDRRARSESLPIDTFFGLLDLAGSRFTAPQIFALLSSKSVRRKFEFTDEELALVRQWIDELEIRWGIDEAHHETVGIPGAAANTWEHAIDRLLLGYAMPGEKRIMFGNILPYDEIEGEAADTLGRFVTAVRGLAALLRSLTGSRALSEWADILRGAVEDFLEPGEPDELADIRFVRAAIETLRDFESKVPGAGKVEFAVIHAQLLNELEATSQRGTFFTGGITFCALKPVRSVPARVICLLGLHDKVFPRRPHAPQFDLMASRRRSGDPSPTLDDRYAFLEAVMAAQDCLVVTYIGRSAVHNKKLPPSVVVSELLDYADQAFIFPGDATAATFLVREHPLHAFSPRYFLPNRPEQYLSSYSAANAEAARAVLTGSSESEPPFICDPLPVPWEGIATRDLRELLDFIVNPPKFFVRHRLGMQTKEPGECLDDTEPFSLDGLDAYRLKEERVVAAVESQPLPRSEVYRALGVLPAAAMGELALDTLERQSEGFTELVQQYLGKLNRTEPVIVDIELSKVRLTGTVAHLFDGRIIRFRPTTVKPRDRLRAWVEHLALCAMLGSKAQKSTILSTDALIDFNPVKNASEELDKLNALFEQGELEPLPFFPKTSWAFMAAEFEGKAERAVGSAWKAWHGDRFNEIEGEKDKPEMQRCFGDQEPFRTDKFVRLARAIYEPMHQHEQIEVL